MASATERITLGTAVIPISAVPPDAILRRIDETGLLAERLRLGIGSGSGSGRSQRMAEAVAYLRERTPAEIVVGALGPRMRELGATLADGVLLNTVTPDLARAAAEDIRAQAKAASRPVPGVYVNVMAGSRDRAAHRARGNPRRSCSSCPPTPRTSAGPASARSRPRSRRAGLSDLPRLLEPWRDTVDEVVLVPVRADEAGPARDLVDAAIAGFYRYGCPSRAARKPASAR